LATEHGDIAKSSLGTYVADLIQISNFENAADGLL